MVIRNCSAGGAERFVRWKVELVFPLVVGLGRDLIGFESVVERTAVLMVDICTGKFADVDEKRRVETVKCQPVPFRLVDVYECPIP